MWISVSGELVCDLFKEKKKQKKKEEKEWASAHGLSLRF